MLKKEIVFSNQKKISLKIILFKKYKMPIIAKNLFNNPIIKLNKIIKDQNLKFGQGIQFLVKEKHSSISLTLSNKITHKLREELIISIHKKIID